MSKIIDLPVSAGQVRRRAQRRDAEVRAFHSAPLNDEDEDLRLEAIHLKARSTPRLIDGDRHHTRKRGLRVAYGLTLTGIRRILDCRRANAESEAAWSGLLWSLYRRGWSGEHRKLIRTDGGGGWIAGVQAVGPVVPRPRCGFHKMPNVAKKLRRKDPPAVRRGWRKVDAAAHRREAERPYLLWARRLREVRRRTRSIATLVNDASRERRV